MTYNAYDYLKQCGLKSLGFNPGATDGLWGAKSTSAYNAWQGSLLVSSGSGEFDLRTETNIHTLHPQAQVAARKYMTAVLAMLAATGTGIIAKITSGLRTYGEQTALYNQGRTTKGPVVTNAPAGYSDHNFGFGWDITLFGPDGQPIWDSPLYMKCAEIAKAQGLDSGAFWKSIHDEPHVTYPTGVTLAQMRARHDAGQPLI